MSGTDWRGLCEELASWIERATRHYFQDPEVLIRARAALAQPEPEVVELSDESVEAAAQVIYGSMRFDRVDSTSDWVPNGNSFAQDEARRCAHAVLSRFGRPAPAPAGERQAAPVPVAVSERLPEPSVKVLAHYFNVLGKGRTICAIWVPAKTRSDSYGDDDFTEYDEESDTFYWPEGWYEVIENWDDFGYVKVYEGEVMYWQPLPKWPARALPLPGEVEE